jgi:hypothetical protein
LAPLARQHPSFRPEAVVAGLILFAGLIETFWFVHHYTANALYSDQWTDVSVVHQLRAGMLTFNDLWGQHNENRVFFPHLVVLALAQTTHLNVVIESFISAALWWVTAILLVIAHHRRSTGLSWLWYTPIALVFASAVPLGDTLFGFNLSWFMAVAALAVALFLLDRSNPTKWVACIAILVAVAGSYSTLQGLLIWPAGLVLLLIHRRSKAWLAAWSGSAILTFVVFLIGYRLPTSSGTGPSGFGGSVRFFFSSLGNVIDTTGSGSNDGTLLVLGVLIFVVAVGALTYSVRHPSHGSALGSGLITFGLLFAVVSSFGRSRLGLESANRYCVFTLMIWCGSYFVFLRHEVIQNVRLSRTGVHGGMKALASLAFCLAAVLLVLQFLLGWRPGIEGAAGWHTAELERMNVAANSADASDGLLVTALGPDGNPYEPAASLRQYVAEAKADRLSFFSTPAAAQEVRQGLDRYLNSAVIRPVPGSTLSGSAILDAAVGDVHNLKRVQFMARSSPSQTIVVGTARGTGYGWIDRWNTLKVRNGRYGIFVVVSYESGPSVVAASVPIIIHNETSASGTDGG